MTKSRTSVRALAAAGAFGLTLASVIVLPLAAGAAPNAVSATVPAPHMPTYSASSYVEAASLLPSGLVAAARRDLHISGAQYLAEAAAANQAVRVVAALSANGVAVLGSKMSGTTLVVNVMTPAGSAAVIAAGAVPAIGSPILPALSGVLFKPMQDIYDGQAIVWSSPGTGYRCSAGFTGFALDNGASQLVTAGHCLAAMSNIRGSVMTGNQSAPNATVTSPTTVGSPVASTGQFGSGNDSGLVSSASVNAQASALTWGGGAGAPLSSAPLSITGQSAAIVNSNLCKSGSSSGWTCGTVKSVDQNVSVQDDSGAIHTVNSIIATTCVIPGDSGGAALVGQTAVGISSSRVTSPACGQSGYYAGFFPMVSAAGKASVTTQLGSRWEPRVTVSTPAVTTANGGTTMTGGNMSGTLANSDSARSTILVYLDGSTTPSATGALSNGNWNVTLPKLTSGSHTYSVIARWGSWSNSIAATGTVTTTTATPAPSPSPTPTPTPVPMPTPAGILEFLGL